MGTRHLHSIVCCHTRAMGFSGANLATEYQKNVVNSPSGVLPMSRTLLAFIILIPHISTPAIAQMSQGRMNFNAVELRIRLAYANRNVPAKDLGVELMDQFGAPLSQHE